MQDFYLSAKIVQVVKHNPLDQNICKIEKQNQSSVSERLLYTTQFIYKIMEVTLKKYVYNIY